MGCDIHLAVEVRQSGLCAALGVPWSRALPVVPDDCDPLDVQQAAEDGPGSHAANFLRVEWYDHRCYAAFSVLAGVRGCWPPISKPRGLPKDVSPEVAGLANGSVDSDIWLGDHSHSWLTLSELEAYDWTPRIMEEVGDLYSRLIPALRRLAEREGVGPDGVRIVFGFDS